MRLRRKCDGRHHRWGRWVIHDRFDPPRTVWTRDCKCGSVQRYKPSTGATTIWSPDGIDSGLLDRGTARKIFEELD